MLALLAAATILAGPQAELAATSTPNLYQTPAHCRDAPYRVVDRFGRPLPDRLGNLPRPAAILLVERRVNGCPVITVMRGQAPPRDDPNPPASQHRLLPLRPNVAPR